MGGVEWCWIGVGDESWCGRRGCWGGRKGLSRVELASYVSLSFFRNIGLSFRFFAFFGLPIFASIRSVLFSSLPFAHLVGTGRGRLASVLFRLVLFSLSFLGLCFSFPPMLTHGSSHHNTFFPVPMPSSFSLLSSVRSFARFFTTSPSSFTRNLSNIYECLHAHSLSHTRNEHLQLF